MPIYPYGAMIRQRREELGYTQEELADGICSVPTLSRIENGERLPTKEHSEMLLQRLGYADAVAMQFVSEQIFALHNLKYRIRQAVIHNQKAEGLALLDEFESLTDKDNRVCQQFLLLYRTIFTDDLSPQERATRFLAAIRMTRPSFDPKAFPRMLSYEEILCVNNYACYNAEAGELDEGIEVLLALRQLYENNEVNPEEALRTRLMVLYNLSKFLGMAGRYEDCIAVCDEGIRISRETSRCSHLDRLLYNKAWSLLKRGGEEDRAEAKECIRLAICSAEALNKKAYLQHYRNYMQTNFG